ncbi:hypothetical protein LPJ56_004032, partial [Coemansia sp. RSA 2599]
MTTHTATTTTAATTEAVRRPPNTLCLFSPSDAEAHGRTPALSTNHSSASSSTNSLRREDTCGAAAAAAAAPELPEDSWPLAVEALAQRLWDCGRDALGGRPQQQQQQQQPKPLSTATTALSQLEYDAEETLHTPTTAAEATGEAAEELLCDGPYVRIEHWSRTGESEKHERLVDRDNIGQSPRPAQRVCCRGKLEGSSRPNDQSDDYSRQQQQRSHGKTPTPPLSAHNYHHRPMDNPFKTMLKQPSVHIHGQKAPYILTPYKSMPPSYDQQQQQPADLSD